MADKFELKSLKERLADDSEAFKELEKHVKPVDPKADIDPKYLTGSKVEFRDTSPAHTHASDVVSRHESIEGQKKTLGKDYVHSDEAARALTESGQKAHTSLDRVAKHADALSGDIQKVHTAAREEVTAALKKGTINAEQAKEHFAAIDKEMKDLVEHRGEVGKLVEAKRADIAKRSGVSSKGEVQKLADIGKDVARNAEGKRMPIAATKELAEEEWKAMSKWKRFNTARSYAWENSGGLKKTMRVLGTGVGAIIGVKGVKDFVAPGVDENGQQKERDMGTLFKSLAEVGIGGTVMYFSLAGGGKGHALGK